jgi:hypothetical protein
MSLAELTRVFSPLAHGGIVPSTGRRVLSTQETKRVNALMLTCGFYDESGEFAFRVGLPGKSGVGGGIITVFPGRFTLAAWSPGLNAKGNSLLAMRALEMFTSRTGLSLLGTSLLDAVETLEKVETMWNNLLVGVSESWRTGPILLGVPGFEGLARYEADSWVVDGVDARCI